MSSQSAPGGLCPSTAFAGADGSGPASRSGSDVLVDERPQGSSLAITLYRIATTFPRANCFVASRFMQQSAPIMLSTHRDKQGASSVPAQ